MPIKNLISFDSKILAKKGNIIKDTFYLNEMLNNPIQTKLLFRAS